MPTEDELYKELGALTKARDKWEESIPYVSSLLNHEAEKIQAKALWLLGEMGFANPQAVQNAVPAIASFMNSPAPLLRERSVNAIGRIGRGDYHLIEPYWREMFRFASDENASVRLSLIWHPKTSRQIRRIFMKMRCRYLRNCCMIRMIKSGWKPLRSSAFSASAGRNLSVLSWRSCKEYRKRIATVL